MAIYLHTCSKGRLRKYITEQSFVERSSLNETLLLFLSIAFPVSSQG